MKSRDIKGYLRMSENIQVIKYLRLAVDIVDVAEIAKMEEGRDGRDSVEMAEFW